MRVAPHRWTAALMLTACGLWPQSPPQPEGPSPEAPPVMSDAPLDARVFHYAVNARSTSPSDAVRGRSAGFCVAARPNATAFDIDPVSSDQARALAALPRTEGEPVDLQSASVALRIFAEAGNPDVAAAAAGIVACGPPRAFDDEQLVLMEQGLDRQQGHPQLRYILPDLAIYTAQGVLEHGGVDPARPWIARIEGVASQRMMAPIRAALIAHGAQAVETWEDAVHAAIVRCAHGAVPQQVAGLGTAHEGSWRWQWRSEDSRVRQCIEGEARQGPPPPEGATADLDVAIHNGLPPWPPVPGT